MNVTLYIRMRFWQRVRVFLMRRAKAAAYRAGVLHARIYGPPK